MFAKAPFNGVTFRFAASRAHLPSLPPIKSYNFAGFRATATKQAAFSPATGEIMLIRYLASAKVKGQHEQAASVSPHN